MTDMQESLTIPDDIVDAADKMSAFYHKHNCKYWIIQGCASREWLEETLQTVEEERHKRECVEVQCGSYEAEIKELRKQLEEITEQNKELAATLNRKNEALFLARKELNGLPHSLGYIFTHIPQIDEAISLMPHAALVAKIKADAVRDYAKYLMEKGRFNESYLVDGYADRIVRGEVM